MGGEADEFFAAYGRPHCRGLRLNARAGLSGATASPMLALGGGADFGAAHELASGFIGDEVEWQSGAYRVKGDLMPGSSLMHLLGLYYMQEPSAMSAGAAPVSYTHLEREPPWAYGAC